MDMKRLLMSCLTCTVVVAGWAQGSVRGKVLDKQTSEPLGFVNVQVTLSDNDKFVAGGTTDINGNFNISGLDDGSYNVTLSYIGYREVKRTFTVGAQKRDVHYNILYLAQDAKMLQGVTVTGQKATMKLEVDRKTFDVSQLISKIGRAHV